MTQSMQASSQNLQASLSQFMSKVYFWMMLGFVISGGISYEIAHSPSMVATLLGNHLLFNSLLILQLVCVFAFSAIARRCSALMSALLFLGYCVLTGVTLSLVYFAYTQAAISQAFFITAGSFLGLSVFGYVTQRDLGFIGTFCMMGLFGLIIVGLLSLFLPAFRTGSFQFVTGGIGLIVFAGLTAYDTQRIKYYYLSGGSYFENETSASINFALTLYLDFINLFLSLLRLFGGRR